jgi:hypothetical protein
MNVSSERQVAGASNSASGRIPAKRSLAIYMGIFDQAAAAEMASSESSSTMMQEDSFKNTPAGKFPSLSVSSKRNATKRRKRDKAVPPHAMVTSTALKFKAFYFSPFNTTKSEKPAEEEESDTPIASRSDTMSPAEDMVPE